MIKASKVIEIFSKYGISNSKDENKYEISELDGITNTSYVVGLGSEKYVLRIPGDNPDVINRASEKHNTALAQEYGITLPYIIFDEKNGIKISEFFDVYTYKEADFKDNNMRKNAFEKLNILHNSGLVFEHNFSPLEVFNDLADISNLIEEEAKEVGLKIVKKLNEIGINNNPCHQDLYSANFVVHEGETYLIDWEYSSMGDPYFDYADLFWQNELELDKKLRKQALEEIGVTNSDEVEKFEVFEILSMITWGLWALKRSQNSQQGHNALTNAINLSEKKKL